MSQLSFADVFNMARETADSGGSGDGQHSHDAVPAGEVYPGLLSECL